MWRHTPVTHKSHAKGYSVFDAKNQVILLCSVKETGSRTQHSIGILLTKEINTALQVIKVNINWESWWIGDVLVLSSITQNVLLGAKRT